MPRCNPPRRKNMANREDKVTENIEGRYYVDHQCIDCNLCRDIAVANFAHQEEAGYAYVNKQPESDDEEEQCAEAKDSCPVEAIGDDGE
jgi:ferredoxin